MNKYIYISIIFIILLLLPTFSFAHVDDKIQAIEINVYIQDNGDAIVEENWTVKSIERFSYYKAYNNLKNSKIANFSVKDETDLVYTYLSKWNTSMPNENKINRCGINKTDTGIELCWGVSSDGNHEYTLNYHIINFVQQYLDKQGIYFEFISSNFVPVPDIISIKITSSFQFNNKNCKIFNFGFNGEASIQKDGNILIYNAGPFNNITGLVSFNNLSFNLDANNLKQDISFNDLKKDLIKQNGLELKIQDRIFIIILIFISIIFIINDTMRYINEYKSIKEE